MKTFLTRLATWLGLVKTPQSPQEQSFLMHQADDGVLACRWSLRDQTKTLIEREAGPFLYLRLRQVDSLTEGHGISIAAVQQVSLYSHATRLSLPAAQGKLLLELGYKTREGQFITLHFETIDLGTTDTARPGETDWFPEPKTLHELMYDLATRNSAIGGSERICS